MTCKLTCHANQIELVFKQVIFRLFSVKLGVIEDHSNRTRLAKLLRFYSSNSSDKFTSLADYVSRMKEKQETIYFMAGTSRKEVENSPFVERLLKKGYEVLYLTEPIDEYCVQVRDQNHNKSSFFGMEVIKNLIPVFISRNLSSVDL